jgi:hypothetical protein
VNKLILFVEVMKKKQFDLCLANKEPTHRSQFVQMPAIFICITLLFLFLHGQVNALNCPENKWACSNGIQCINATSRCDSIVDCVDGSDEGALCSKLFCSILKLFYLSVILFISPIH